MRKLSRMMAGAAALAAAVALVAGGVTTAASADPIGHNGQKTVPAYFDIVGVGSNTTEYVMDQISVDYNKTIAPKAHSVAHPYIYSYDALPAGQNAPNVKFKITPKAGCKVIERPDGSTDGLNALDISQSLVRSKLTYRCIDYARSSGGRKPTSPKEAPGGVVFDAFAKDAITWAARSAAAGGSDAPASMNTAQLKAIFSCTDTNWSQVGGKAGAIKVYLPQSGSGTLSTWEKFMGITTVGSCVSQAPEENEGTFAGFNSPNAIFIYSVADWIAQRYHSPLAGKKPTAKQNAFGTDQIDYLGLNRIDGISPTTTAKIPTINTAFKKTTLTRTIYDVVRWTAGTPGNLPKALVPFFASKAARGYVCANKTAITEIADYGFLPSAACGSAS
jgi:ABC-type phosphate transport system substrate-binding protein